MQAEYPDIRWDGPPGAYNSTSYPKRYVAIHNTSNDASDTAEANYAETRPDHISSHYYVDVDSITQSLRTEYGANHAGSTTGNRHAIAYEITGTNGKSRAWWLANVAWAVLARQIARDCRKWGIPARLLTVAQMRDGKTKGIVTHDLMRQAWGGTTHTDPGPGFPIDHLLALVRAELEDDMQADERQWLRDIHYALFTADAANRPAGSVTGKIEGIRATALKLASAPTPAPSEPTVTVTDEQLERVLRRVLGMAPAA
ncbi:peptidoglycan recognition family protein [Hamadaea sp. NPDC050747]|uniref:peptidoglycan recognition protein family protein n=1 Tax=Hamadaea sp. NPDC050747 TaxID=3155789 RepID=UPI0033FC2073